MVTAEQIYQWLESVKDPEIPVLSIRELGVLREIRNNNGLWEIMITPTYSGCPAMFTIEAEINRVLKQKHLQNFRILTQLSPPWTTDFMPDEAKEKLRKFGIAPPGKTGDSPNAIVFCPHCKSNDTQLISRFGSTACKAMYRCNSCLEPFEAFKCI